MTINPDKLTIAEMPEDDAVEIFKAWRRRDKVEWMFSKWASGDYPLHREDIIRIPPKPATRPWCADDHNVVFKIGDELYGLTGKSEFLIIGVTKTHIQLQPRGGNPVFKEWSAISYLKHNGNPCTVEVKDADSE